MKDQILIDTLGKIKESINERNFKWNEKHAEIMAYITEALSQYRQSPQTSGAATASFHEQDGKVYCSHCLQ